MDTVIRIERGVSGADLAAMGIVLCPPRKVRRAAAMEEIRKRAAEARREARPVRVPVEPTSEERAARAERKRAAVTAEQRARWRAAKRLKLAALSPAELAKFRAAHAACKARYLAKKKEEMGEVAWRAHLAAQRRNQIAAKRGNGGEDAAVEVSGVRDPVGDPGPGSVSDLSESGAAIGVRVERADSDAGSDPADGEPVRQSGG